MPFLDLGGNLVKPGSIREPISTPHGKIGIAICNEIVKPEASWRMVENGAEFLMNSSNDGWFANSSIVGLHFLYARLSAVITRKDVVVNSNNGFSGLIKASGEVLLKRKSSIFFVESVILEPNRYDNSKNNFPNLVLCLCLLSLILTFFFKMCVNRSVG